MALTATPVTVGTRSLNTYDFAEYVKEKVKPEGDSIEVFHHARTQWATPDQFTRISTRKSGGLYGKGFYTSTRPEKGYGAYEFDLKLPVAKLAGHKVLELAEWSGFNDTDALPAGVDVLAVKAGDHTWFVFKPGSEWWVNAASTESDFDKPGEPSGP